MEINFRSAQEEATEIAHHSEIATQPEQLKETAYFMKGESVGPKNEDSGLKPDETEENGPSVFQATRGKKRLWSEREGAAQEGLEQGREKLRRHEYTNKASQA